MPNQETMRTSLPLRKQGTEPCGKLWAAIALIALALLPNTAAALDPVYSNWRGLAIRGTDPVAYFTEGKPVAGSRDFVLEHKGATWRFANDVNRKAFRDNPSRYEPQYGGYCAWAISQGYTASIDPEVWTIVEGKLYLNYSKSVEKDWLADRDALIQKADVIWSGLRDD